MFDGFLYFCWYVLHELTYAHGCTRQKRTSCVWWNVLRHIADTLHWNLSTAQSPKVRISQMQISLNGACHLKQQIAHTWTPQSTEYDVDMIHATQLDLQLLQTTRKQSCISKCPCSLQPFDTIVAYVWSAKYHGNKTRVPGYHRVLTKIVIHMQCNHGWPISSSIATSWARHHTAAKHCIFVKARDVCVSTYA